MGEKAPRSCLVVDAAIVELRNFHSAFPIVDVNRVAYQAAGVMQLDVEVIRQALRLVAAWGSCLYQDWPEEVAETVGLDPTFFAREVLLPLLRPATRELIKDGVLRPGNLRGIWPALASRKNFDDLASRLVSVLEHLEILFHPHDEEHLEAHQRSVIVPALLPLTPPPGLFPDSSGDFTRVLWPQEPPPGLLEIQRILVFRGFSAELIPRIFIRVDRELPLHSVNFRHGSYFGRGRAGILMLFDNIHEAAPGSEFSAEARSGDGRPPQRLIIKIRDINRGKAKKWLDEVLKEIEDLAAHYPGMALAHTAPSPHDPLPAFGSSGRGGRGTLLDLHECLAHHQESPREPFLCPATRKQVDLWAFLLDTGILLDPAEKEAYWWTWFRTEMWSLLSEDVPYSRFLFLEGSAPRRRGQRPAPPLHGRHEAGVHGLRC